MDDLEKVQAQIAELQKKSEELIAQKKPAMIEEVRAKMKAYGITTADLSGKHVVQKVSSLVGSVVPVKYRQGEHTWSGRGQQPAFIKAYIAGGGKKEDLLVN